MKFYKQNLSSKSDLPKMDFVLKKFSDIYQIKRNLKEFISPSNSIEEYNKFSLNSILNFYIIVVSLFIHKNVHQL